MCVRLTLKTTHLARSDDGTCERQSPTAAAPVSGTASPWRKCSEIILPAAPAPEISACVAAPSPGGRARRLSSVQRCREDTPPTGLGSRRRCMAGMACSGMKHANKAQLSAQVRRNAVSARAPGQSVMQQRIKGNRREDPAMASQFACAKALLTDVMPSGSSTRACSSPSLTARAPRSARPVPPAVRRLKPGASPRAGAGARDSRLCPLRLCPPGRRQASTPSPRLSHAASPGLGSGVSRVRGLAAAAWRRVCGARSGVSPR